MPAVASRIGREMRLPIVLVGGEQDRRRSEQVGAGCLPDKWLNLCGDLSILETAALLERAAFYLGNDTGPMHVAAAVKTPCVAVFSMRAYPETWYPYGDTHEVIAHEVPCIGCGLKECKQFGLRCLLTITVDEVWDACVRVASRLPL